MNLKKQQIIILAVVLVLVVSVVSVALLLNTENGGVPNGNGDVVESGEWVDLYANIASVATDNEFGSTSGLSDVFFVDENEGWATTSDVAEIYHTTDGGETWEVQTTQLPCNAIWMLNKNEGYAGGKSGFVYRTTNGGQTWNLHGTISATLTDISFYGQSSTGFACGLDSASAQISPKGVTLTDKITNGVLSGVSATASNEATFCGGSLLLRYNGSAMIGDQFRPSGGYNAIFMLNNEQGWAVGDSGIIIHTTDGVNWFEQTNPKTNTLFDVEFLNANEGWAIGTGGTIIHTTNGGTTWTVKGDGQTTNSLTGVSAPTPGCIYISGNNGTFLKYVAEN
ncbi:MAG: hypothetical protein CW716_07535 [Candidatus Bathyarchaeum sp.]|nr:MAG: hypothetical protein CW716_07535 [Candidatus Bathyarchaeum sp.]